MAIRPWAGTRWVSLQLALAQSRELQLVHLAELWRVVGFFLLVFVSWCDCVCMCLRIYVYVHIYADKCSHVYLGHVAVRGWHQAPTSIDLYLIS